MLFVIALAAVIGFSAGIAASRDGPGERGLSAKVNSASSAVVAATGGAAERVLQTAVVINPNTARMGTVAVAEIRWLQRFNEQGRKLHASDMGRGRAITAMSHGAARYPLEYKI